MSWTHRSPGSNASSSSPSSTALRSVGQIHSNTSSIRIPSKLVVKSKFDSEFRRFSLDLNPDRLLTFNQFRNRIGDLHLLHNIPFTLCYTSNLGDLLPITNDENFRKSFESSKPCLRLLIQRKGESWEEKFGYGTETIDRKRKGISSLLSNTQSKQNRRNYNISNPEDFRQVSAIIDVDVVPETHRRVRLCKYGEDKVLGFFIRDGAAVRLTPQGAQKVSGIFISRLVAGGLAESSGLLGVNDEVIEVNGIDVHGKTLDQVTDMMLANAHNLIITIKPANQRNTLQRGTRPRISGTDSLGSSTNNRRSMGSVSSSAGPNSSRHNNTNSRSHHPAPPMPSKPYHQASDSEEDEVTQYFDDKMRN
jgi:partitioning defective protein 6